MNEFLQQFLLESRELAEQATAGLLALERTPQDTEQLDAVFRAVHTLKGGAGIVDFFAMERAVHAAEDLLSAARAGRRALSTTMVGDCLACLDLVLQWLDTIEQTGDLPSSTCENEADRMVSRFSITLPGNEPRPAKPAHEHEWLGQLLERHPDQRALATVAIRYTPDPDCFYQGEDPLTLLTAVPGLLAFEATSSTPWPSLAGMDPYRCNLILFALTASTAAEVSACLRGHSGECEIAALARETVVPAGQFPGTARDILAAQLALMRENAAAQSYGHVASAVLTASNVLQSCGRTAAAADLARLSSSGSDADMRQSLQAALTGLLEEGTSSEPAQSAIPGATGSARSETTSRSLRVDAERIDSLVRLTGELTIAKNALTHLVKLAQSESNPMAATLKSRHAEFERLVGELQRSVLALRVLPLRVVFQRFPRLMREMSASLGKPVELKLTGEDTEADKAIVEMLFEPLLHVMRNAMDHGVENEAIRAERGKPRQATIEMRASRQGDQVLIEIADDGGGMNLQRIRSVAAKRGVATAEVVDKLTEAELGDLVFAPGFSTATEVTALSGRGVGMDAVRTAVERVGGRVSIQFGAGVGTTVSFLLPFSVMMTTVMSVEAGGQMFGVPLDNVIETIRVPRSALAAIGTAQALVVRDQTIPVFDLARMLGDPGAAPHAGDATIVIAAFAGQRCGLDVQALGERMEIILKPLDGLLAGTPGITGTTLLGDGRVLLVLDIGELLQ